MLDDHCVWIGSYDFEYTVNKQSFIRATKSERKEVAAKISNDEYHLLCHERHLWIVYGRFLATAQKDEDTLLHTFRRFTFVWKQQANDLKLLHINCSMARNVPLVTAPLKLEKPRSEYRWFDYICKLENPNRPEKRVLIKDDMGNIHYLLPSSIFYICMQDRVAQICTSNEVFFVRRNLSQLMLDFPSLLQVHKSWLVNPSYVHQIRRYTITLSRGFEIPIGKSRYNQVKEALDPHE